MQQELQGRKGKTDRHFVNGLSDSGDGACGSLFSFLYARAALPLQSASFALARCGVDTVPNFNALNRFKNILLHCITPNLQQGSIQTKKKRENLNNPNR